MFYRLILESGWSDDATPKVSYNRGMKRIFILFILLTLLSACAGSSGNQVLNTQPIQEDTTAPSLQKETVISTPKSGYYLPSPCNLPPITIPTMPAVIPGYTELDPATGLHMTGNPLEIDLSTYRLKVSGLVDHPLELNFEELRCFPKITVTAKLVCPGYFIDESTWSGVPIVYLLEKAGLQKNAKQIDLISADGYETYIALNNALNEHNFLAYEWKDQPLPVLHGFPVRAVFPQMTGFAWVKWLVEIKVQ